MHALKKGNLEQRPLIMDNAGVAGNSWLRQEQASKGAFPASNHYSVDTRLPDYENIVFVDGHGQGVVNPPQRTKRISH